MTTFRDYINELAMKKGTKISPPRKSGANSYLVDIILENGEEFEFSAYYNPRFNTEMFNKYHAPLGNKVPFKENIKYFNLWEIGFVDKESEIYTSPKSRGTSIELFAALEQIFKKFIMDSKPEAFEFSVLVNTVGEQELSKIKLYNTLARKIEKVFKNYKGYHNLPDQTWNFIREDLLSR